MCENHFKKREWRTYYPKVYSVDWEKVIGKSRKMFKKCKKSSNGSLASCFPKRDFKEQEKEKRKEKKKKECIRLMVGVSPTSGLFTLLIIFYLQLTMYNF